MDGVSATIRTAQPYDAEGIASVHVASWQETYAALLPAEMLAELSVSERTTRWVNLLEEFARGRAGHAFVAEAEDRIVGFASVGAQRSKGLHRDGFDAEITAIYVLERVQRQGIGRGLLRSGADHLRRHTQPQPTHETAPSSLRASPQPTPPLPPPCARHAPDAVRRRPPRGSRQAVRPEGPARHRPASQHPSLRARTSGA